MKYLTTILISCILIVANLQGQVEQKPYVLASNNIRIVEAYVYRADSPDSALITKEYFNKAGRQTAIQVYDTCGGMSRYEYIYEHDTLRVRRNTYFNNNLASYTTLHYDRFGNEKKTFDYTPDGRLTGNLSKKKYNKKSQLSEQKTYIRNEVVIHERYTYHDNGKLATTEIIKPKKRRRLINYDISGKCMEPGKLKFNTETETTSRYDNGIVKHQVPRIMANEDTNLLGVAGFVKLKKDDILRTEIRYYSNGLFQWKIQYRNDELLGKLVHQELNSYAINSSSFARYHRYSSVG